MSSILSDETDNGSSSSVAVTGPTSIQIYGTFDGCRAIVEASHDDTNWSVIKVVTRPDWVHVPIVNDYHLRVTLVDVSANTSVSADTTDAS